MSKSVEWVWTRRVAPADATTEEVFARLCEVPSRYSVIISMTEEYAAYSPQLTRAIRIVGWTLKELGEKEAQTANLYYYGPEDHTLSERELTEPTYDYKDGEKLAVQVRQFERAKKAPWLPSQADVLAGCGMGEKTLELWHLKRSDTYN